MEMDKLFKSFELMRSALVADNTWVVREVCEKIISELALQQDFKSNNELHLSVNDAQMKTEYGDEMGT